MEQPTFNPFTDRLSRDLRNDLSEGLVEAILSGNDERLQSIIAGYDSQPLAKCYRDYLDEHKDKYKQALASIANGLVKPLEQAVVLWNLGLFFEVHEVLEHAWYTAEGAMKQTLQAMIRAAGVYIKREFGYHAAAMQIAQKAAPVLHSNRELLLDILDPDLLVQALLDADAPPPTFASKNKEVVGQ